MTLLLDPTVTPAASLGPIPALTAQLLRAFLDSKTDDRYAKRYDYAHENQFGSDASYWKGRRPAEGDFSTMLLQLVMDDQIGPSMSREVNAQFARDPEWAAIRNGKALDINDEIVVALTAWHLHNQQLVMAAKDVSRQRFWAGRMVARVYIPDKYTEDLKLPSKRPKTLADALKLVRVKAVDPRQGTPLIDVHGDILGYVYRYSTLLPGNIPQGFAEVHTPQHVLLYQTNAVGSLQLVSTANNPFYGIQRDDQSGDEYLMWHTERDGGSALSESVLMMQDRLNVVTTYMGRNDDQTGYRQFIVSNAEQPKDAAGRDVPYQLGPGVAIRLVGTPYDDLADGQAMPRRHEPKWTVIDPLDPGLYHVPSIDHWKGQVLATLDQHWTIDTEGRSGVSGESKRQSRKPFEQRVAFASQDAGAFMAWALRAALLLAASMLGKTQAYQDVTFQPKFYLDVDAANLEELKVKLQMWQSGGLTLTSLLEATPGVEDPAAEQAELEKQRAANPVNSAREDALKKLVEGDGTA